MVASRNNDFDALNSCSLGAWRTDSEQSDASARFNPRHTPCLDAGPWYLFAVQADQVVHAFSEPIMVENGLAGLERTGNAVQVGHAGEIEVRFDVHRPAASDGFDGLYDHPINVWITDGDVVCVANADPLHVARVPIRSGQSWHSTEHASSVSVTSFKRVRNFNPFEGEVDVPHSSEVSLRGDCKVEEGSYDLLVGPTESVWSNSGTVAVHAPPTEVDSRRIEVSVPAGQVVEANGRLRNFSGRAVSWSANAVSQSDGEWLIGAEGQTMKGKSRRDGVVSISAANLTPGRYTADLRVVVDDFYGTQVLVPVEVNVLTARSRTALGSGAGEQSDQPTAIQLGNYPNPFSASTTIRLELATGSDVRIHVYDMTGREVRMLQDGYLSMGMHEFRFEADDLPSGTYLYRVSSSSGQETGTMTLVR